MTNNFAAGLRLARRVFCNAFLIVRSLLHTLWRRIVNPFRAGLILLALLGGTTAATAETLSLSFSRGFIGPQGNGNSADSIITFATLGVTDAYFIQDSDNDQFGGTGGNDLTGTVRLVLSDGSTVDIPGTITWRIGANPLHAIGVIPTSDFTLMGITYVANTLVLQFNDSTQVYTDGSSVSGNAAASNVLNALNSYLALQPAGPVTATSQTTSDTTPDLAGTATLAAGDALTVTVNGITYDTSSGLSISGSTWSLTIPAGNALSVAIYDVTAVITGSNGATLTDATSGELTIIAPPPPAGPVTAGSQTTSDTTPDLAGTATLAAGDALTVAVNGITYDTSSGLSISGSTWSLTIPAGNALSVAIYDVTAVITGSNGATLTDATSGELTIIAPPPPPNGPVTASSQTTSDTTPDLAGTATLAAGDALTVAVNGITYDTSSGLSISGSTWSLTIPAGNALSVAIYDVTAVITGSNGATLTDATSGELTIIAPPPPPAGPVTAGSQTTSDTTPDLAGTATLAAGDALTVAVNGITYDTSSGLSISGSTWSLTIPAGNALSVAIYDVTAVITGSNGATLTDATSGELTIIAPPPPVGPVTAGSQTTSDTTPDLAGTATLAAGDALTVAVNGITYDTSSGLSISGSTWSLTIPAGNALSVAIYDVTAVITGSNGATLTDATSGELTIIAPPPPPAGPVTAGSQTTSDTTPDLAGTATLAAGDALTVTVNGITYDTSSGLSISGSTWSLTIPAGNALSVAIYDVTAVITGSNGATLTDATSGELTIFGDNPADTAGILVVDLDLQGSEDGGTGSMSFALESQPSSPVTLTFSGDGQCEVSPGVMTFTDGNWADIQTLTITPIDDGIPEGNHTCLPAAVVSSPDGDYDVLVLSLSEVAITDGLAGQINAEVKEILRDDLAETLARQSDRFSRVSQGALSRLKAGRDIRCGSIKDFDVGGTAEVDGGDLNANGRFGEDFYDCLADQRRITAGSFSFSNREGFGHQIAVSALFQSETFASDDSLSGRFFGGYLSSSKVDTTGEGTISGLGLNAGLYRAMRLGDGLFLDYYLAGAAGRHDFDLSFGDTDAIDTTGHYTYAAAFAGLALSGERAFENFNLSPRLGIDLAHAFSGDVGVTATQFGSSASETIQLSDVSGVSWFAEMNFSSDQQYQSNGLDLVNTHFEIAPRGFCEKGYGNSGFSCGFGGFISWTRDNATGTLSQGFTLDLEKTDSRESGSIDLFHTRRFTQINGSATTRLGTNTSGNFGISHQLELEF